MTPELSVIVFALNEAENLPHVLAELRDHLAGGEVSWEIVFVDDGSSDGSLEVARRALEGAPAHFVRHSHRSGIGAAIKSGVVASTGAWVTFLPADGQVPPSALDTLCDVRAEADVVLSTYERRDDGFHRKVLSGGVRALIFLVHGVALRSEGPYLFRRTLLDPEQIQSDSFFLNFEFPILASRAGLRIEHVVVPCRPRLAGQSKTANLGRIRAVARDLVSLRARRLRDAVRRQFR